MPFRVSFVYKMEVARTGGWTENFWNNNTDIAAVIVQARSLAGKLQLIHGSSSVLRYIRLSNASGDGLVKPVPRLAIPLEEFQNKENDLVDESEISDYPTTALLLVLRDSARNVTRQWTKGVRDEFVQQVDGDTGGGGFLYKGFVNYNTALGQLKGELVSASLNWVIRILDPAVLAKEVVSIDAAGLVTTREAHQFEDGQRVRIKNCRRNTYPNRIWRIRLGASNTTFTLQQWAPPMPFIPVEGTNITVRSQSYKYSKVTDAYYDYATKRNIGRPFRLLSGKSKVRL